MISRASLLLCTGPILLGLLVVLAGYAYSQVLVLSLPISQLFAIFTALLPIVTGISTLIANRFLRSQATATLGQLRPNLYFILLLAFQLIYETVITTLALTYMVPPSNLNCGLEERWKRLYMSKDESAVKRIQNRFDCCGFNSVVDRPWPFPHGSITDQECSTRFSRTQSCAGPWRQAEQINAGLFLIVGAILLMAKLSTLVHLFSASTNANAPVWFPPHLFRRVATGEVEEGRRLIGEGEPQQGYRDETEAEAGGDTDDQANRDELRMEPSGLLTAGEGWREHQT